MIGGPVKDEVEFIGSYIFATDLLQYVKSIYGEKEWYISYCAGTGAGVYFAEFKDYWEPSIYKQKRLIIRASQEADRWVFSIHKVEIGKG